MKIAMPSRAVVRNCLFLAVLIVAATTRLPILLGAYATFSVLLIASNLEALRELGFRERVAMWILIVVSTACLPIAVMRNATAIAHYAVGMVSILCAVVVTRNLAALCTAMRVTLVTVQILLIVYSLSVGIAAGPLDKLLAPHTSSNGVTSALIILQASFSLLQFALYRKITLPTAVVTLAICILGFGRGSIVASAIIVAVLLAFSISWNRPWRTALIFGALILVGFTHASAVVEFVTLNTKIRVGFEDAPRQAMISQYLARIDGADAFFGADFRGTVIEEDFLGNPHNSYIRAHHLFGLPYLLGLLLFVVLMVDLRQRVRMLVFGGLMIMVVAARAFTEAILFPAPMDFYFFSMCLALNHVAQFSRESHSLAGLEHSVTR
jgi:hypothetical protein